MSRKSERAHYCRNKIYSMLGKMDEHLKLTEEDINNQMKDYVPEDAPLQCKDCKLVRLKCYNPMKKKFGQNFTCEKKVKKEEQK
jgi:hypothetical protein